MFFDILSNILFFKKKNCFKVEEDEKNFSPFLINRWISMYSPSLAKQANIINKYLNIFETKYQIYAFFLSFFDKVSSRKINYVKRKKEDNDNNEQNVIISQLSKNFEISNREIRDYINMLNS